MRVLQSTCYLALAWAATGALASLGEVPVVDGVFGGVPDASEPDSVGVQAWENPLAVPGKVRLVENSRLCEKTPGVYEAAGYADLTKSDSIWFWFFEARNNPDTAPLVLWFNGGPGSSSMYGLFQAHGPCRIANDSSTVNPNPFSWNTNANVLYIDQPIGVGFSVGMPLKVGRSVDAAGDVWDFLQIWLEDERFAKFKGRELGIWAESYGGHYGPAFARHFLNQNAALAEGTITGTHLNLTTLGLGNGLTDPLTQYASFVPYSAHNPYHPLVNNSVLLSGNNSWVSMGGCRDQIVACNTGGSDAVCSAAQSYCNNNVLGRLAGEYDVYYVPARDPDPYPADFSTWLNQNRGLIETQKIWVGTNYEVYGNFAKTGDWMRSSRGDLESVVNEGVKVLVYCGDADYILNYFGMEAMMDVLETKSSADYRGQAFQNYTVNGIVTGVYKNAGSLSYIRVFGAGHMVPAYTYGGLEVGEAALQMFDQFQLGKEGLIPT
ncbi:alpha/beta-hydrolase [Ephemerocybe angulata]|uniref:Carboxypeptidase n=1 Tax=Ephemerocybe angulata TaxID=980116 RepID=A0A8H6I5U3_9AGAR|nr:alpha/beta-hydrolase [Tulosesus angulatus]